MWTQRASQSFASGAPEREVRIHLLDYIRVIRLRIVLVLLSLFVTLIVTGVTTYFMPRVYRSTVLIELKHDSETLRVFEPSRPDGLDPRFAPTQFEIIQSKEVLYPVIERLELTEVLAGGGPTLPRELAYEILRGRLSLNQIRNTEMLALTCSYTNPVLAADIANAVAESYQERKREQKQGLTIAALARLDTQLAAQRVKVGEMVSRLATMRKDDPAIIDNENDRSIGAEDPRRQIISTKEEELSRSATQLAAFNSQLNRIESLQGDELLRAIPLLDINDPTISKVFPLFQEAVANEAALIKSGLGAQHPKVQALRAQKLVYSKQLTEQIDAMRHSLEIRRDIARATAGDLSKQLKDLRDNQRSLRQGSSDYFELKEDLLRAKTVLAAAEQKYSSESIERNMPQVLAVVWNRAEPAMFPSIPRVALNLILGAVVGLLLGIGLALVIEYLDTSIKTIEDAETILDVPVVGVIPSNKGLHDGATGVAEVDAYRILQTNLECNRSRADANAIAVQSGGPGEGKSTTVANLAVTCAKSGYSVLIVDAALREPRQHQFFNVSNEVGLAAYLSSNISLDSVIYPTGIFNLWVIPSGIAFGDPSNGLNSRRLTEMVAELKARYDLVFFDGPPILGESDATVLASEVDQSLVVVQHRRYSKMTAKRVAQAITNVGGSMVGAVLNNVDTRHDPTYLFFVGTRKRATAREAAHAAGSVMPATALQTPVAASDKSASQDY